MPKPIITTIIVLGNINMTMPVRVMHHVAKILH